MQLAAQHIPLAVHPTIHRLFVSDATFENFENRVAVHFLTAYRTADQGAERSPSIRASAPMRTVSPLRLTRRPTPTEEQANGGVA
ncbi:MAG TPA: hypothetical protein VIN09_10580 [Chloroflexota bacterium]